MVMVLTSSPMTMMKMNLTEKRLARKPQMLIMPKSSITTGTMRKTSNRLQKVILLIACKVLLTMMPAYQLNPQVRPAKHLRPPTKEPSRSNLQMITSPWPMSQWMMLILLKLSKAKRGRMNQASVPHLFSKTRNQSWHSCKLLPKNESRSKVLPQNLWILKLILAQTMKRMMIV